MSSEDRDKHVTVANVFKVAAEEAKDNKAFLLTCIGVITLWLGQIIILVLLLNFKVPSALVTANVISFIITLPLGALSIYNNYCVVHGCVQRTGSACSEGPGAECTAARYMPVISQAYGGSAHFPAVADTFVTAPATQLRTAVPWTLAWEILKMPTRLRFLTPLIGRNASV